MLAIHFLGIHSYFTFPGKTFLFYISWEDILLLHFLGIHSPLTYPGNTYSSYISWEYILLLHFPGCILLFHFLGIHSLRLIRDTCITFVDIIFDTQDFFLYFRTYSWPRLVEWAFVEQPSANCFYVWSVIRENI